MVRKFLSACLLVCILTALPVQAMAKQFEPLRKGTIYVTLAAQDGKLPMAGAELSVYYVATVGINTDGKLNYICNEEFAEGGIELDNPDLISALDAFVTQNDVPAQKMVTNQLGLAVCSNLPLGLYFIKQTGEVAGFATCPSFYVTVPMETETEYQYQVNASPKTDVARLTDITIQKVWNTGGSKSHPSSVTVQLLRNDEVVKTAVLDEQNKWKVVYTDLPEGDGYSIKEVNVPKGYKATYRQSGYVFTVTNTNSLAQTGQLVWPIPVLALAGMLLLMAGIVILRKSGKRDA